MDAAQTVAVRRVVPRVGQSRGGFSRARDRVAGALLQPGHQIFPRAGRGAPSSRSSMNKLSKAAREPTPALA